MSNKRLPKKIVSLIILLIVATFANACRQPGMRSKY